MDERRFDGWLSAAAASLKRDMGTNRGSVVLGDSENRVHREVVVKSGDDSMPFWASQGTIREGSLKHLRSIVVLSEPQGQMVRVDLLRYYPDLCVGGTIEYTTDGSPKSGDVSVELDFDISVRRHLQVRRAFKENQVPVDYWSPAMTAENRKRIALPEGWTRLEGKLVYSVQVESENGQMAEHSLDFPERMTVEMIMEASRNKGLLSV